MKARAGDDTSPEAASNEAARGSGRLPDRLLDRLLDQALDALTFTASPDAVLITDLSGTVIDCNPAAETVLGRVRERILGVRPGLHDEFPEFQRILAAVWRDGEWTADVPIRRDSDGGSRIGAARVVAVYDDDNQLVGTVGTVRDVTEQRRNAVQLAQTERRWRLALDLSPTGLALLEGSGRFVRANEALCRSLGYSETELRRMTLVEVTHPDDQDADQSRLERLLAGGQDQSRVDKRYRHARGGEVWVRESIGLARDPLTGRPEHLVLAVENITAHRQSAERLASILSSCSDAFVGIDSFGQITEWNPAAEQLFGWQRLEVLGQLLGAVIVPAAQRQAHREGLARMARNGEPRLLGRPQELVAQRRDGVLIPVELTVWRSSASTGEFFAFIREGRRGPAVSTPALQLDPGFTDPMTGLASSALVRFELDRSMERQGRRGGQTAVALIDLDGLDAVNQRLGRAGGDELLVGFAGALRGAVRGTDIAARFGGDEFLVLCEDVARSRDTTLLAERLTELLPGPYRCAGQEIRIGVSLALVVAERRVATEQLLTAARNALDEVKRAGGGGCVVRHLN